ncbi:kinase-like domain-containing protein [Xylaria digitata]|nr:kinase-like domain-containing protein [Xylaria digitata]
MCSYTPITLPYFAPGHLFPAPLPTHEEVLSSTNYLSPPPDEDEDDRQVCVVCVGSHFLAKYGTYVRSLEGENMLFVNQQTTIPVPRVYAIYEYGEGSTMIIMERIEGVPIHKCLETLDQEALHDIGKKLKAQINELRQIPAPAYYGAIGRRPFIDPHLERHYGPFDSFSDYVISEFDLAFNNRSSNRFKDIKRFFSINLELMADLLGHDHPVFTHADIHASNVILRPDGTPVLIDYELSGYYPAYRESFVGCKLDCDIEFLDEKFDDEIKIMFEARCAWVTAENEERESEKSELLESEADMELESQNQNDPDF